MVPLVPKLFNPPRSPWNGIKWGDIPNKYGHYIKVYMGLIIKGTTPRDKNQVNLPIHHKNLPKM